MAEPVRVFYDFNALGAGADEPIVWDRQADGPLALGVPVILDDNEGDTMRGVVARRVKAASRGRGHLWAVDLDRDSWRSDDG